MNSASQRSTEFRLLLSADAAGPGAWPRKLPPLAVTSFDAGHVALDGEEPRPEKRAPVLSQKCLAARELALSLMKQHGLVGWQFAFIGSKRMLGRCVYPHPYRKTPGRIELSVHACELNPETEILDTVLHEIAHALVGPGHLHDEVWKQKCLEIGAKPVRCATNATMPMGRWQATCNLCGYVYHRHRRPRVGRLQYCSKCGCVAGMLVWTSPAGPARPQGPRLDSLEAQVLTGPAAVVAFLACREKGQAPWVTHRLSREGLATVTERRFWASEERVARMLRVTLPYYWFHSWRLVEWDGEALRIKKSWPGRAEIEVLVRWAPVRLCLSPPAAR